MSTSSVSTASSFNVQMMQQTFDYAIEDTCRNFGLLYPFKDDLERPSFDGQHIAANEENVITNCEGMTYEGFIHQERLKKSPPSYYHVQEMNKGPVDYAPRLASIPSQYQLESLTEMYVCDYPKLYQSAKCCEAEIQMGGDTTTINSHSDYLPHVMDHDVQEIIPAPRAHEVHSQYISELLY